ncbi:MAG: hypothetical protein V4658_13670, partial [Bacteroidota bacterium]
MISNFYLNAQQASLLHIKLAQELSSSYDGSSLLIHKFGSEFYIVDKRKLLINDSIVFYKCKAGDNGYCLKQAVSLNRKSGSIFTNRNAVNILFYKNYLYVFFTRQVIRCNIQSNELQLFGFKEDLVFSEIIAKDEAHLFGLRSLFPFKNSTHRSVVMAIDLQNE